MSESSALTPPWIFPRTKRARASRLTINFEIFDLRSVSRAFQLYACEQWPPTPEYYIYSPIYLANACTHPSCARIYMYAQRRKSPRIHSVACISPSFPFRSRNFRSISSLLDIPRKNEEKEPRCIRHQSHCDLTHSSRKMEMRFSAPKNIFKFSLRLSTIDSVKLDILFPHLSLVLFS